MAIKGKTKRSQGRPSRRVWWFPQELEYPLAMFPRRTMDLLIADRAARAAVGVALYRITSATEPLGRTFLLFNSMSSGSVSSNGVPR